MTDKQPTGDNVYPKPPNFDSLTLRAVVDELGETVGGHVQEARRQDGSTLWLGVRLPGRTIGIRFSIDARFARAHASDDRPPNAPKPDAFLMAARRALEGGTIESVIQHDFDRVMEIVVSHSVALGEGQAATDLPSPQRGTSERGEGPGVRASRRIRLIAELMGRLSNLILVDEAGNVIDAAKRVTSRVNRYRETLPGLPYVPPPAPPNSGDPFAAEAAEHIGKLAGVSPFLAREIEARTEQLGAHAASKSIFGKERTWDPVVLLNANGDPAGAYPIRPIMWPPERIQPHRSISAAMDEAYRAIEARSGLDDRRRDLLRQLSADRERIERRMADARRAIAEADRADRLRESGEILLANIWRVSPGDTSIAAPDWYDPAGGDRVIELDPKLTANENADLLFRRARKARDGEARARAVLTENQPRLERLTEIERAIVEAATPEALEVVSALLKPAGVPPRPTGRSEPRFEGHRITRLTTASGHEIYVGESATANDYLTTRVAAPNDIWLHVRSASSSHVIIRTHGDPESIPRSVIEEAARICARHSGQKHSSLVAVDYTLRKYVRKPRKSSPGSVEVRNEKTIEVTP